MKKQILFISTLLLLLSLASCGKSNSNSVDSNSSENGGQNAHLEETSETEYTDPTEKELIFNSFKYAVKFSEPTKVVNTTTYEDTINNVTLNFSSTLVIQYDSIVKTAYSYSYQKLNDPSLGATELVSTYTGTIYSSGTTIGEVVANDIQWTNKLEGTLSLFKFNVDAITSYEASNNTVSSYISSPKTFFNSNDVDIADLYFECLLERVEFTYRVRQIKLSYETSEHAIVNTDVRYSYYKEVVEF